MKKLKNKKGKELEAGLEYIRKLIEVGPDTLLRIPNISDEMLISELFEPDNLTTFEDLEDGKAFRWTGLIYNNARKLDKNTYTIWKGNEWGIRQIEDPEQSVIPGTIIDGEFVADK